MTFEWDENKNQENIINHKVSFWEAQEAFDDPNRLILEDVKHSKTENRFFCLGRTAKDVCTVRFTMRKGNIRIIGAGYWRREKKYYEEYHKNNIH